VCIQGVSYGLGTTEIGIDRMRREGIPGVAAMEAAMAEQESKERDVEHVNFVDGSDTHPGHTLATALQPVRDGRITPGSRAEGAHIFMLHMVLNHTVVPETIRNDAGEVSLRQVLACFDDFINQALHMHTHTYTHNTRTRALFSTLTRVRMRCACVAGCCVLGLPSVASTDRGSHLVRFFTR